MFKRLDGDVQMRGYADVRMRELCANMQIG